MNYATIMHMQARFPRYAHTIAIIAAKVKMQDLEPQYDENGLQW